jgi:hypothetical protein
MEEEYEEEPAEEKYEEEEPTAPPTPPPPPQPQAPRPPPQQPMQPQYQQQPYQQQYQQPAAPQPTPPPKKSKKGLVIGVVVVVAILIVAMLAYLFIFAGEEGPKTYSATYEEFLNDLEYDASTFSFTFKTYDVGDIVYVTGTVDKVKLVDVPAGAVGADSGTWTLIYFEKPEASIVGGYDCFAYKGDKSGEYTIGEEGTVRVHIKKASPMGFTMEFPEEWQTAGIVRIYIEVPTAAMDFTETTPGNYTGGIVSASGTIFLNDIKIEIYDDGTSWTGNDDGDLTDGDPEEIEVRYGNLRLECSDVNNNDILDAADVIKLYDAESGDRITIRDADTWDTIGSYTIP